MTGRTGRSTLREKSIVNLRNRTKAGMARMGCCKDFGLHSRNIETDEWLLIRTSDMA